MFRGFFYNPGNPPGIFACFTTTRATTLLIKFHRAGLTLTETWSTANVLTTKLELDNNIAKGLKAEAITVSLTVKSVYKHI